MKKLSLSYSELKLIRDTTSNVSSELEFNLRLHLAKISVKASEVLKPFEMAIENKDLTAYNNAVEALNKKHAADNSKMSMTEYTKEMAVIERTYKQKLDANRDTIKKANRDASQKNEIEIPLLSKKQAQAIADKIKNQQVLINLLPIIENE